MAANGMQLGLLLCLLLACLLGSSQSLSWSYCSHGCKSKYCTDALLLRYGRYCGLLYSGCHDEAPCDGLDSCCKIHDNCVGNIGYLKVNCNQNLLNCLSAYNSSGQPQFPGATCSVDTVISTIFFAIEAGVWIGKELPPLPPLAATNDFNTSTGVHGD